MTRGTGWCRSTKTGHGAGTESYVHDANSNVISQTVGGVASTFNYDRNRLLSSTSGGATAAYNYDPFGRLDTVTAAGTVVERNVYDGFDHVVENRKTDGRRDVDHPVHLSTRWTARRPRPPTWASRARRPPRSTIWACRARCSTRRSPARSPSPTSTRRGGSGCPRSSTTRAASDEDGYYGYNPHTDVETLTDATGDTKATYGYTAYGSNDSPQFTGIDTPDPADPTKEPYNPYRFNAKRWDANSNSYDMGFRDYSPGLNRYLTRDSYNGALADLNLGLDPFTSSRYAFAGGNPITGIELDGHMLIAENGGGGAANPAPPPPGIKDQVFGFFKNLGGDIKANLDELDRRTVHNPDWALYDVYQTSNSIEARLEQWIQDTATNAKTCVTGDISGCEKLETGAEDVMGITAGNECFTEGIKTSCGWAAAAGVPFFGKLRKLLGLERGAGRGVGAVVGPYGAVERTVLERAAAGGGPTTRVVTNLTSPPVPGRPLSVATGDMADALAAEARAGGTVYTAQIPNALLWELRRVGLAQQTTTRMGGVTGTEIRFLPGATEFLTPFFGVK